MITLRKLKLLAHIARWRLTWNQYDLDVAPPSGLGTKFITARRAASMILDGSTVIACRVEWRATIELRSFIGPFVTISGEPDIRAT
jgi:hypothetical protein